jgi:fibronectin type 3 domain-containing protein
VTAVSHGQSISLIWLPNTESDLAGYYVFRSGEEHNYKKLTQERITTASYTDSSVEKGKTYYYRIMAVDFSGNESNYSEEVSDKVE